MTAQLFNSLGGYSVGIPAVEVVDANGNVVTNVLTSGNVAANVFYASEYKYANGQSLSIAAAGSNTQVQFNDNGQFGADPYFTYDFYNHSLSTPKLNVSLSANLGNISNLTITGGNNGYFLQTDGTGNLNWAPASGGGGNGSPGGANTQVQFNADGAFGGVAGFTYNTTTNTLAVTGTVNATNLIVTNATLTNVNASAVTATGNVTANYFYGNGTGITGIVATLTAHVTANDQPNITSVGVLDSLSAVGNIISTQYVSAGNLQTAGNITGGNLTVGPALITGTLRSTGNVNFVNSPNISMGPASNVHITGGLNGYVLTTDGLGNLSWQTGGGGGGGNGEPGGANMQIQYNNNGLFDASPYFTFDSDSHAVTVAGNLIANSLQIGSGIYEFCTSEVYFASTVSSSPNQVLFSIPTASLSGVDFHIIATDTIANTRQSSKISSLYYAGTVQYTEYAGLQINGGVGEFDVTYNPGDIITPPAIQLLVTPDTADQIIYRMLITVFAA